jgi:hypothetical protein
LAGVNVLLDEIIEEFIEYRRGLLPSFSDKEGPALLCAIFGVSE